MRYEKLTAVISAAALALSGCAGNTSAGNHLSGNNSAAAPTAASPEETQTAEMTDTESAAEKIATSLSKIDPAKWNFNAEDNVYWQVEIPYCENPAMLEYETLGIFVPAAYMEAADNGDGTYTC